MKNIKAAVVTICDRIPNYGNRLQNYAVINILKSLDIRATTLLTESQDKAITLRVKRCINFCSGYRISERQLDWKKSDKFLKFNKKYLHTSFKFLKNQNVQDKYDYFVLGSDQVWNPEWYNEFKKNTFLLTFAKPEQKICMAPSFGVEEIPAEWKDFFKEQLQTFPLLSVREKSGAKIIKALTGKNAEVIIDPTLMLDAEQWRKIERKSRGRKQNEKYILKYFLGTQSNRDREHIESIARDNNYKIYELLNKNQPLIYDAGPSEFIDLVDHAELICTDSFHACIFSILFNKPFMVFDRDGDGAGMGSRISTLLLTFGLERKMPGRVDDANIFEHDYSDVYKILKSKKKKVYDFLKRSMRLENEH